MKDVPSAPERASTIPLLDSLSFGILDVDQPLRQGDGKRSPTQKAMCRWCKTLRISRLGITSLLAGGPDQVGFFCDRCEYEAQGVHFFGAPSFFVEYEGISQRTQRQVTRYIQRRYIGKGQLTQP